MSVKSFLKCITSYENVCVEDENFNVFASGVASDIMMDKAIRGLQVVECHTGVREFDCNRRSSMCLVIIAQKG